MAEYDLQIKGGTVVDGTRVPRYRADLWIKHGTIAQIGGRGARPRQKGDRRRRIQPARGYRSIIVDGVETFAEGKATGAAPGKLLRHGRA